MVLFNFSFKLKQSCFLRFVKSLHVFLFTTLYKPLNNVFTHLGKNFQIFIKIRILNLFHEYKFSKSLYIGENPVFTFLVLVTLFMVDGKHIRAGKGVIIVVCSIQTGVWVIAEMNGHPLSKHAIIANRVYYKGKWPDLK